MLFGLNSISEFFSDSRMLGYLLWGGLAALSLTLMILMRTRWGQAKPISKCIALSVFAHVLLGGYAYGTRLIFQAPERPGNRVDEVVELSFIDTDDGGASVQTTEKPWDAFMGDPVASPDVVSHERMTTDIKPQEFTRDTFVELPTARQPATTELADNLDHSVVAETEVPKQFTPQVESKTDFQVTPKIADAANIADASPLNSDQTTDSSTDRDQPNQQAEIVASENPLPRPEAMKIEPKRPDRAPNLQAESTQPIADIRAEARKFDSTLVQDAEADQNLQWLSGKLPHEKSPQRDQPKALFASHKNNRKQKNDEAVASLGVRRLSDGQKIPALYALRMSDDREAIAIQNGGSDKTEKVVSDALRWLASAQSSDGRWDASELEGGREDLVLGHNRGHAGANADTGITGITLLAFLGAGHSHLEGDYQQTVARGLEYLLKSQNENGSLSGRARLFASMYCHGIATLALSEAYALTGDPQLQPYVQRALDYSIKSQHKTTGGWRYRPGDDGDMSQFGWQVMALKSGQLAGVSVPLETKDGMHRFLASVTAGDHGGLARYRRGEKISPTMTAEAMCCRIFLGQSIDHQLEAEASSYILGKLPQTGKANYYYWYYGTMAMYQLGGDSWDKWNEALQRELIARQRKDGPQAGSFDPNSVWGGYGGRAFTTAMAALSLEVYYRYLPILEAE